MPEPHHQHVATGMLSTKKPLHLWVPGICEGAGGIQAFSRVYVKALRQGFPAKTIRVFTKNDCPPPDDELRALGVMFHSAARFKGPLRTLAFVAMGVYWGLKERARCSVATHIHFLPPMRFIRWLRGTPYMGILHGIEAWNLKRGSRVNSLKAADHLAAVSHFTRQHVIESLGVNPHIVSVVPNTFDTERFNLGPKPAYLLERYGLKPEHKVLLTVSRLAKTEHYKGHRQVLAALPKVREQVPGVRYLIVGTGDDMEGIREAVRTRGLQDCVILAGHVPGSELADHYRLCDAFVMPSSKEGFGIVFLEAMATGKPVLAGCLDGSVDALDKGRLSPLVDPNDAERIAEELVRILSGEPKEALWHQPAALRAEVVALFGFKRVSRLMADDIGTAIGERSALDHGGDDSQSWWNESPRAPVIVVVCRRCSPELVNHFNQVSASGTCFLDVIYVDDQDPAQRSEMPGVAHTHVVLGKNPELAVDALRRVKQADLVVIADYSARFSKKAVKVRAASNKAWTWWGEPHEIEQEGLLAKFLGRCLFSALKRTAAPIWTLRRATTSGLKTMLGRTNQIREVPLAEAAGSASFLQSAEDALARWRGRAVLD